MRRIGLSAFLLAIAALTVACSGSGSGLTGKVWQLTAITEKVPAFQGVVPAAEQSRYTVSFATDGTFSATADCNQVAGSYKTSGSNGLAITPGPSTLAFCGEGSFGDLFVHSLSKAASYAIANDQLTITLSDEGTMTFAAASGGASAAPATAGASAAPPASEQPSPEASSQPATSAAPGSGLTGKAWQLTAVTEKVPAFQGVIPDDQQAGYSITFADDGSFSGHADCNSISGSYTTADPTAASGDLAIEIGASTRMACPEGSFADLYLIGLSQAASYAIATDELTITLSNEGTLVFK